MNELRRQLRKQRRQLTGFQQRQAEYQVFHRLIRHPNFKNAQRIGIYLHAFGEIRTQKIIEYAFSKGKKVYLPKICNMNQCLVWVQISQQQYRTNRFSVHTLGMLEPMESRGLHVSHLDLLLMPLLACDLYGTRIGMGGGFYDRTLASAPKHPLRFGLAHHFQLIKEKLPRQIWDQTIDGLITPTQSLQFIR